jgi:hypothetical protein
MNKKNKNGAILYEDGEIVTIVTGLDRPSQNTKTGGMLQIHILLRSKTPLEGIKTGADSAICGSCIHRGDGTGKNRSCYVNVGRSETAVWNAYDKGMYPKMGKKDIPKEFEGALSRFGAYGDPANIPLDIVESICSSSKGWTGYTQQWKKKENQEYKKFFMASAEGADDVKEANGMGWRTFRAGVKPEGNEAVCKNEVDGTKCEKCLLCCGNRIKSKNVFVTAHGTGKKYIIERERK